MAETGENVENLLRQCFIQKSVLQNGSDSACCALGTEGELALSAHNGEHFLLDHVCGLAYGADEKVGIFKCGDTDLPESVIFGNICGYAFDSLPFVNISGNNVLHSLDPCGNKLHNSVLS